MGHWNIHHWFTAYDAVAGGTSDSVLYSILEAVQTGIRNAGLATVASASVIIRKLPLERYKDIDSLSYPLVLITPGKPALNPSQGDNVQDDVVYPIHVAIWTDDNQERTGTSNFEALTLWAQQIRKAFHMKGLSGVSTVYTCHVEQARIVLPAVWNNNRLGTELVIKAISREHRNT